MHKKLFALSALLLSLNVSAAQHSTDLLDIEVQPWSYGSWPDWSTASYEILQDGVKFSPSVFFGGGNSGFPEQGEFTFNVTDLSFAAKSGYKITGYEFSFSGIVSTSNQASATISGGLMGGGYTDTLSWYGGSGIPAGYVFSTSIGADNPAGGQVSAYGSLYFDAPYYVDWVYDEYGYPLYEIVLASGSASITMDSVTIKAFVAPIPEPETYLMFLAGIGAIAWRARRTDRFKLKKG